MALPVGKKIALSTFLLSLVAILPLITMGSMAVITARQSFIQDKFEQLEAMRGVKKSQIEKFFEERKGDMGVLVETIGTLRQDAFDKLTSMREVKRAAVERYFQSINDQIITFSQNRMVIDAMRDFKKCFHDFRRENGFSASDMERMRRELLTYYTGPFSTEYSKQNEDRRPDVEPYFHKLDEDSIALQYHYIQANHHPLGAKHLLDRSDDGSGYSRLHGRIHPIIRNYLEKFGYYDIFLVDIQSGDIVYSVFKELDFSTSLLDGPNAKTQFGEAFRKAASLAMDDGVVLVDYAQYTPSYESPASFIASPIFDGNEKIGVAMFQMPIDRLNTIMGERAGLGRTGETYLVGPDGLMRSDAHLDPVNHSVVASFKKPAAGKVATIASTAALSGKTGADVIQSYNGHPVLSAYSPVRVGNYTWALLAEIEVSEAFSPVNQNGQEFFAKYKEMYGYYDLFLINPDGYCFYTVAKESDYRTNLVKGQYADTGLGRLVRQVMQSKQFGMADFAPYAPSNNEPSAFIAQPVMNKGNVEVVVALQLSIEAINSIMQEREGMGKTGETYLVGADNLMRSDSFLDPDNHSVKASFSSPAKGSVDTEAVRQALAGKTESRIVVDYNGNRVLSAYTPLKIADTTWVLLAEIDEKEVISDSVAAENLLNRVWMIGVLSVSIVIAVILFNVFLIRNLSSSLRKTADGLKESAEQVASAAGQVSTASQSLSQGASEQAASIEETSSSLEEMASMTRQNADHATQADNLMKEARQVVGAANTSMDDLTHSMQEISKASEETSKIIKTIDEIAFQTNLLALNAAVEAARAGEAGTGFAVVADEVRNLAMRAAESAKNTANLIAGTVKKVNTGSALVAKTNQAFAEVSKSTAKVGELVGEIAAASSEQAQGITQINTAVNEVDQVTQQNAASAEESASASEEMNAQAEQMRVFVNGLLALVNGTQKDRAALSQKETRHQIERIRQSSHLLHGQAGEYPPETTALQGSEAFRKPDKVIPLDDGTFGDF